MKKIIEIKEYLERNELKHYNSKFNVPALWLEKESGEGKIECNPYRFFIERIDRILELANEKSTASKHPQVYNMFVRLATAYDHRDAGCLNEVSDTFKQHGTFLKAIALLPYLKKIGIDTIYLLPITSIGKDGNKGNLGSPYSIRNPYKLDEHLAEDNIPFSVEQQFAAFVEAAKLLGMKVILEFVFRTASLDCDMALEHPEWFYWIKQGEGTFKPPTFSEEELLLIMQKVEANELSELPAPHAEYLSKFIPSPKEVKIEDGKIIGISPNGEKLQIPNAFADWPPDDNQPLWSDVTYLKIYDHDNFNYIAYNTIRMYDEALAIEENENKPLWEHISGIIPHYIQNYDIDGVMIDMGHALPQKFRTEIAEKARKLKQNFIFWEENFVVTMQSKDDGYDAVLGYMPFDYHVAWKVKNVINSFSLDEFPIDFFLTPETHNTKRAASREGAEQYSKITWLLSSLLPSIKFIHNGFELGEKHPVNTGLGFDSEEIAQLPPEHLPLFSSASLNWDNQNNIVDFMVKINNLIKAIEQNDGIKNIELINANDENIVAFKFSEKYIVCCNFSDESKIVKFPLEVGKYYEPIFVLPANYYVETDILNMELDAWGASIGKIE